MDFNQFRNRMIPPQACAEELCVSEFTIHRWIREEKISAVKLTTRCTRIDGDSLADFLINRQSASRPGGVSQTNSGIRQVLVAQA